MALALMADHLQLSRTCPHGGANIRVHEGTLSVLDWQSPARQVIWDIRLRGRAMALCVVARYVMWPEAQHRFQAFADSDDIMLHPYMSWQRYFKFGRGGGVAWQCSAQVRRCASHNSWARGSADRRCSAAGRSSEALGDECHAERAHLEDSAYSPSSRCVARHTLWRPAGVALHLARIARSTTLVGCSLGAERGVGAHGLRGAGRGCSPYGVGISAGSRRMYFCDSDCSAFGAGRHGSWSHPVQLCTASLEEMARRQLSERPGMCAVRSAIGNGPRLVSDVSARIAL